MQVELDNAVGTMCISVPAEAGFAIQHADRNLPGCSAELKGLDRVESQWQQPHVSPPPPLPPLRT